MRILRLQQRQYSSMQDRRQYSGSLCTCRCIIAFEGLFSSKQGHTTSTAIECEAH